MTVLFFYLVMDGVMNDEDTGAVRDAVNRLIKVYKEGFGDTYLSGNGEFVDSYLKPLSNEYILKRLHTLEKVVKYCAVDLKFALPIMEKME